MTVTASATEALLLEANLIKRHRPRYNVQLRDDKSFPYIRLETEHEFPRVAFYRGPRKPPGRFFGPYPSAVATRETLLLLQKLFRVRPCEDTFFANRSRPCLQYQIQRCTGPCVGLISREDYAQDVADAMRVLDGRNTEVIADLGRRMEEASRALKFEDAARLRDQVATLKQIQSSQTVTRSTATGHRRRARSRATAGEYCVAVVFVRAGRNLGSSNYFPKGGLGGEAEALAAFLAQYYLARGAPAEILVQPARWRIATCWKAALAGAQRAPGEDPLRRTRHARALARDGPHERGAGLEHARLEPSDGDRAARCARARAAARSPAGTDRVLRREPHDGRIGGGVLRGVRRRGPDEERVPPLQPARAHAGRRLRGPAPGASSADSRASSAANRRCPTCCSSTAGAAS